jgi:hypothetical protein
MASFEYTYPTGLQREVESITKRKSKTKINRKIRERKEDWIKRGGGVRDDRLHGGSEGEIAPVEVGEGITPHTLLLGAIFQLLPFSVCEIRARRIVLRMPRHLGLC